MYLSFTGIFFNKNYRSRDAYLISKFSAVVLMKVRNLFQTKGKESVFYKSFYRCVYFQFGVTFERG